MSKVTMKGLQQELQYDKRDAKAIMDMVKGNVDPEDFEEDYHEVTRYFYHPPDRNHAILLLANHWADWGFGVEGSAEHNYSYINAGDTYDATLVYDGRERDFLITSWGDIEEERQREMEEEEVW